MDSMGDLKLPRPPLQQAAEADWSQERDWSKLLQDLLIRIFGRLDLPDLVCSGAVCTSWYLSYSAVRRFRLCSPDQSPYLVYSSADRDNNTATLHNISTNKIYHVPLPDPPFRSRFIMGSSQGWLVTADEQSNLHLLNPFSGAQIALPPARSMKGVSLFMEDGVLSGYYVQYFGVRLGCIDDEREPEFFTAKEARHYLYEKVVLSSDPSCGECIVLIKHRPNQQLSFARVGDTEWTWLHTMKCCDRYQDVFYNGSDGLFYAIRNSREIHTVDLTCSPPVVEVAFDVVKMFDHPTKYILQAPWGELLMVLRTYGLRPVRVTYQQNNQESDSNSSSDDEEIHCIPTRDKVTVHKVNLVGNKSTEIKDLKGHALFVGFNHSFMLNVQNHANLLPNCVYISDDDIDYIYCYPFDERHHLACVNLEDGTLTDLSIFNSLLNWPPPVWFRPHLF